MKKQTRLDTLGHLSSRSFSERQRKDALTPSAPDSGRQKNACNDEMHTEYLRGNLGKRANNLYFSQTFKKALIKHNPKSHLLARYKKSLSCSTVLLKTEDKITSTYCGNRFCNVCNRIATGKAINKHGNVLQEMDEPYFLTLTIPNVQAQDLRDSARAMIKNFARIIKTYQQKRVRNEQIPIKGYRKIEVTKQQTRKDYHPHFHVIIDTEEAAQYILKQWLEAYPSANRAGQDIQRASPKAAKELFKYVTKLLPSKKAGQTWNNFFMDDERTAQFFQEQDVIYQALNNVRTIQGFGYKHQEAEEIEVNTNASDQEAEKLVKDLKAQQYDNTEKAEYGQYNYIHNIVNWIHPDTGELLLQNHKIPPKLKQLCKLIYNDT